MSAATGLKNYAALLRVHHWSKNIFIPAPLFFSGRFTEWDKLLPCLIGFILFSLVASAVYIMNDLRDLHADRAHPEKKKRPLASGAAKPNVALMLAIILAAVSIASAFLLSADFALILIAYAAVNFLYSFGLKNISLLDIFLVSSGFIFRVMAGGVLGDVVISQWMFIMTGLLAVFLAIARRRDDLLISLKTGKEVRAASRGYSIEFINTAMAIMAAVLIVAYLLYVTSAEITGRFGNSYIYASSAFVLIGVLRYLQITIVEENSGSPTLIFLKDRFLQLCLAGWIMFFVVFIYLR